MMRKELSYIKSGIRNKLKLVRFKRKAPVIGTTNLINRETWLENKIKEIPDGYRILDAGAGELQYKRLCNHLNYVSQDFGMYDGKGNDSGLQTKQWNNSKLDIVSDIANIPEPDKSFDAIMCIEVFEHLPKPILALKEFSRLLKKNGVLILSAPFCSLTHFAPYHFYSGFNKYFYEKFLIDFDFEITEITTNGNYFEYLAQEIRRVESVGKSYCNINITLKEKKIITKMMYLLTRLNAKTNKSDELLNHGFHIVAKKASKNKILK